MIRKTLLILMLSATLLLIVSCAEEPFEPPVSEDLPAVIEVLLENSMDIFVGQIRENEGMLYILVTYGEKPTGGYAVEITEIAETDSKLTVTVNFRKPADDEDVTETITYPYDVAVIEDPGLPVEFVANGAELYLPTIYGMDYLPPIVASSQGIKIFTPSPGESVTRQFAVEGVANVFEGHVNYRFAVVNEEVLAEGFTTGAMGDWGQFSFDLSVPEDVENGKALLLEIYTLSAKDGSLQDLVQIDLAVE